MAPFISNGIDSTSGGQVSLRQSVREGFFCKERLFNIYSLLSQ